MADTRVIALGLFAVLFAAACLGHWMALRRLRRNHHLEWHSLPKRLSELGLPPLVVELASGQVPIALAGTFDSPDRFFSVAPALSALIPQAANLLPLWEENSETAVVVDSATGSYWLLALDSAPTMEFLGGTYQELLVTTFAQLLDYGFETAELRDLALTFEFKHLEELLRRADESSDEAWDDDLARFREEVRNGPSSTTPISGQRGS